MAAGSSIRTLDLRLDVADKKFCQSTGRGGSHADKHVKVTATPELHTNAHAVICSLVTLFAALSNIQSTGSN